MTYTSMPCGLGPQRPASGSGTPTAPVENLPEEPRLGVMSAEDMADNSTMVKNRLKAARLARKRQSGSVAIPHKLAVRFVTLST